MFFILLLKNILLGFLINYPWTSIVHILMNNLVTVLQNAIKYKAFYRALNITLDFPVFSSGTIFM